MRRSNWLFVLSILCGIATSLSVAWAVSQSISVAWAGNGDGYNGPTLTGISIPGTMDVGLAPESITKAINTCLVTGDEKRGLVSVLQKLYQTAYGKLPSRTSMQGELKVSVPLERIGLLANASDPSSSHGWISGMVRTGAMSFTGTVADPGKGIIGYQYPNGAALVVPETQQYILFTEGVSGKSRNFIFRLDLVEKEGTSPFITLRTEPGITFPRVAYDSEESLNNGYDEYGREINKRWVYKGISVQYDPAVRVAPLINEYTKHPTAFSLDLESYVDCLKDELQRKSQ